MASIPSDTTGDTRDALTGLADQSQARETIERWLAEWPRDTIACPMHAMMITLGRIDTVNVAFGESAGDGALVEVAQRIRHFAGDELESSSAWTAARLGGNAAANAGSGWPRRWPMPSPCRSPIPRAGRACGCGRASP
jgi:GGDEF domain-containing protein